MSSTKPHAYLSEEARLRAQRRMLAERYGLGVSDDEEDGSESAEDASGSASSDAPVAIVPDPVDEGAANGRDTASFDRAPPASGGTTMGAQVSSAAPPTAAAPIPLQPSLPKTAAPAWPGVVLTDGGQAPTNYKYVRDDAQRFAADRRNLRVTGVTKYASHHVEGHGRKIAVNDTIATYAVGGHIRAIERSTSALALLKGHMSAVVDTEFLSVKEKSLSSLGPHVSILGSVGEDGAAYVWRLSREAQSVFKVADVSTIMHPAQEKGGRYSRIAFRPGSGSIIALNGVGVAVILLDPASAELRVAEMVKMDGNVMLRDRFLRPSSEAPGLNAASPESPVTACIWQNTDVIGVARGRTVTFWSFGPGAFVGRLPRISHSKIHSMVALSPDMLLLSVDDGAAVEIWYVGDPTKSKPEPMRLCQTLVLFDCKPYESLNTHIAADPDKEIIVVANSTGDYMIVLHYNKLLKAVDTITEIPTKNPILSMSLTRSKSSAQTGVNTGDEILLWCVQPTAIQTLYLQSKDCLPPVNNDGFSTPSSHTSNSSTNKAHVLDPVQNRLLEPTSGPSIQRITAKSPVKLSEQPIASQPTVKVPKTVALKPTALASAMEKMSLRPPTVPAPKRAQPKPVTVARKLETEPTEVKDLSESVTGNKQDEVKAKEEEFAQAVLEATRKVIDTFEEKAKQRDELENARLEKLVKSVKEKVEANLEQCVNSALKRPMGNAIIPAVSKIVTDMNNSLKAASTERMQMSESLFAHAMEQSNIDKMYQAGCSEILEQISKSVNKSLVDKCTSLINPAVKNIETASKDLIKTVEDFVKQVESGSFAAPAANGAATPPEDTRAKVTKLLSEERFDEAFLAVLNKRDLELVNWLVGQLDPKDLLESPRLSQVAVLSLAQQLGQRLGPNDEDCAATVDWLRELMLVLEPGDDMIADTIAETLSELRRKVSTVQREKELIARHPGLGKQLKTLFLLISSLCDSRE